MAKLGQKTNRIHHTKCLDYFAIKKIMSNEYNLINRFNEIVKKEEMYEEGTIALKQSIVGVLKESYRIKEPENENTIKNI